MDGQGRKYIIRLYVKEIRLIKREKEKYFHVHLSSTLL